MIAIGIREVFMKASWLPAAIVVVSLPLAAQSTGRIVGKITDSAGKPVANATVTMRRTDTNVTRNVKVDKNGSYIQVGLDPYDFELVVTAEGYIQHKETVRIEVGNSINKDVTLKKPSEATAAGQPAAVDAGAKKGNEAAESYNRAIALFRAKNYPEAMDALEIAIGSFKSSIEITESQDVKSGLEKNLALTTRMLALCQYEIGKTNPERRKELWTLANPVLKDDFEQSQDPSIAQALANIAGMMGDKDTESKYLDAVERIAGPQADVSYNRGVDLYNEGNLPEAKKHMKRAIEIDPKMPEPYYILAICEFSDGDVKATKSALDKYLQLDPKGKYADIVKDMLKEILATDPSLK